MDEGTVVQPPHRGEGLVGRVRDAGPDEYGLVLALLTASYVLYMFATSLLMELAVGLLQFSALLLAVRTSRPGPVLRRTIRVVVVVGLLVLLVAALWLDEQVAHAVVAGVLACVLLVTIVIVLDRVLRGTSVTLRSIAAALSGYLLLGFFFSEVFALVAALQSDPFFSDGEALDQTTLFYFSFTTLTTLGYGDLTAASPVGRGLATFEALVAQVYLVTIVARLVAAFPTRPPAQG